MKKTYYKKIDSVELDICLLAGSFRVYCGGQISSEIEFPISEYFEEFEEFSMIIHENILKNSKLNFDQRFKNINYKEVR
ncbi:MAG: hypothetical protein ACOCUD_03065 [Bacillota bacterium]